MKSYALLAGPLATGLFVLGIVGLAAMVPGYSHVHQTMSEIGEVGSPAQMPFTLMALAVAVCILVFAAALRRVALEAGHSPVAAYVTGCMAISLAGVGVFAFPHPLHNVFGLSELIGYQAPAAFALTWRREGYMQRLVAFSWIMFAFVWAAILLNLSSLDPNGVLWQYVRPVIGIAQRALFGSWFVWCAGVGMAPLSRQSGSARDAVA